MKSQNFTKVVCWVLAPLVISLAWTMVHAAQLPGPLVDAQWLSDHQVEVVILDVRHDASSYLGKPVGPAEKPNLKKLILVQKDR